MYRRVPAMVAGVLLWLVAPAAQALERISQEDIKLFLDDQMTHTMRKEIDPLMALFGKDFQWRSKTDSKVLTRDEVKKIYTNNFLIAKMVLNSIDLHNFTLGADARTAIVYYHSLTRYLIEIQNQKNVISRDEEFKAELAIEDGKLVYHLLEKQ